jgi:16S rRNA (cytosine967-C5)-methyltransferase
MHDATTAKDELIGRADKVICDVPCSGLGVLAKKPDLRYKDIAVVDELCALSSEILEKSASYLKVGGVLAFSTCTLEKRENTDTVLSFLASHPDFSPVDFTVGKLHSTRGELTLYPHIHATDGFYIALIRRDR